MRGWRGALLLTGALAAAPAGAQEYPSGLRLPSSPLAPTAYEQCTELRARWDELHAQVHQQHEACLQSNQQGESGGGSCSRAGCQGLHDLRDQIDRDRTAAVSACRSQVEDHRRAEAERRRREEEERHRAEQQAREREEEERRRAQAERQRQERDDDADDADDDGDESGDDDGGEKAPERNLHQIVADLQAGAAQGLAWRTAARESARPALEQESRQAADQFAGAFQEQSGQAQQRMDGHLDQIGGALREGAPAAADGTLAGFDLDGMEDAAPTPEESWGGLQAVRDGLSSVVSALTGPSHGEADGSGLLGLDTEPADERGLWPTLREDLRTVVENALPHVAPNASDALESVREQLSPLEDMRVYLRGEAGEAVKAAGRLLGRLAPSDDARENLEMASTISGDALTRWAQTMDAFESGEELPRTSDNLLTRLETGDALAWASIAPGPLRAVAQRVESLRSSLRSAEETAAALQRTVQNTYSAASQGTRQAAGWARDRVTALFASVPREEEYETWEDEP